MDFDFNDYIKAIRENITLSKKEAELLFQKLIYQKDYLDNLYQTLIDIKANIKICNHCFFLKNKTKCIICDDPSRDNSLLCVVENIEDVFKIEKTFSYKGMYFVLNHLPQIEKVIKSQATSNIFYDLFKRIKTDKQIKEIILALGATYNEELNAVYLKQQIIKINPKIKVTLIARGIPLGGSLRYVDNETLKISLNNRRMA